MEQDRKVCEGYYHRFELYPKSNLYFLTKGQPALADDLLSDGLWDGWTTEDRLNTLLRLSGRKVVREPYTNDQFYGPRQSQWLEDIGLLRCVREQAESIGCTPSTSLKLSPLWQAYGRAYVHASPPLRDAMDLICGLDVTLRATGYGVTLVGPSTIPDAGCGAITIGYTNAQSHDVDGVVVRKRPRNLPIENPYVVDIGGSVVDGSRVLTVGSAMNAPVDGEAARKNPICKFMRASAADGYVFLDQAGPVQSAELFADYGSRYGGFEPIVEFRH